MIDDTCEEMRLLVQADLDGELQSTEAARVSAHLERCAGSVELQRRLMALSDRVRRDSPRHTASAALRARIQAALPPAGRPDVRTRRAWVPGLSFGAGFAMAACLALFVLLPGATPLPNVVVAAHVRALQPGHLLDVGSSDQHMVKPWFDGRLPFAPPVKDLAAAGFGLIGGRLDYLPGRTAAVLVYRGGPHVIDLFAWPGADTLSRLGGSGARDGYNFQRWTADGMSFWAVSDLNAAELADFVAQWQKA